jgi:hypothetical protein
VPFSASETVPFSASETVPFSASKTVSISPPSAKSKDMNTSQMDGASDIDTAQKIDETEMDDTEMDDAEIDGIEQKVKKLWGYIENPTTRISAEGLAFVLKYVYDNKALPCMLDKQGVRRQIYSIGKYKANDDDSKLVSFTVLDDGSYKAGWIRRKINKASGISTFNRWYLSGDTLDEIILCE